MGTRYVTLAPNTETPVSHPDGFDRVGVYHDNTVDGIVYVDLSGNPAVIPTETDGSKLRTVKMVTRGARRVLKSPRADTGGQLTTLSLKSAAACRVELEFP